jgi:hypothetical protein
MAFFPDAIEELDELPDVDRLDWPLRRNREDICRLTWDTL